MKNPFFLILLLLGLFYSPGVRAQEEAAPAPVPAPAAEEATSAAEVPAPVFTMKNEDILSWQETGRAKHIYFRLTPEKEAEFHGLTAQHVGKKIEIRLENELIGAPFIPAAILSGGFALGSSEKTGQKIVLLLDPAKKKEGPKATVGVQAGGKAE